jgi:hypothetical protein
LSDWRPFTVSATRAKVNRCIRAILQMDQKFKATNFYMIPIASDEMCIDCER